MGGTTPLHMACILGHAAMVELLLAQRTIDTQQTADLGEGKRATPLDIAVAQGHDQICELLRRFKSPPPLPAKELLAGAAKRKQLGNAHFKLRSYNAAAKQY